MLTIIGRAVVQNTIAYFLLVISIGLIADHMPRKDGFFKKDIFSMIVQYTFLVVASVLIILTREVWTDHDYFLSVWLEITKYFLLYISCIVIVKILFESSWWGAIFCGTAGYCIQHIGARIGTLIETIFSISWIITSILTVFISLGLIIVLNKVIILKVMPKKEYIRFKSHWQIFIALLVVTFNIVYTSWAIYYISIQQILLRQMQMTNKYMNTSLIFVYLVSAVIGLVAFFLQFSMYTTDHISLERDLLSTLLEESRRQYLLEKKTSDLINLKSHDLRHQIKALEGKLEFSEMKGILEAIDIYDSIVDVGNEAINIVLTQKSMYCKGHDITLTYLINGLDVSFLEEHELFSLFGNFLDNAIESVLELEKNKRIISITERSNGDFVNIRVENYYKKNIEFEDGLPITNKDLDYHGFGMKSMKMIAERYDGTITTMIKDDIFILNILLVKP